MRIKYPKKDDIFISGIEKYIIFINFWGIITKFKYLYLQILNIYIHIYLFVHLFIW